MRTLGSRIKGLREQHRLSQKELAELLNVNSSTLSQYESDKRIPSDDIKIRIANYFNVSTDYLLGNSKITTLSQKDELDIAKRIEALEADLENQENLMMHGEILDEETRELVKASLATAVRMSKIAAKEKFTPKKYKK